MVHFKFPLLPLAVVNWMRLLCSTRCCAVHAVSDTGQELNGVMRCFAGIKWKDAVLFRLLFKTMPSLLCTIVLGEIRCLRVCMAEVEKAWREQVVEGNDKPNHRLSKPFELAWRCCWVRKEPHVERVPGNVILPAGSFLSLRFYLSTK